MLRYSVAVPLSVCGLLSGICALVQMHLESKRREQWYELRSVCVELCDRRKVPPFRHSCCKPPGDPRGAYRPGNDLGLHFNGL